VSMVVTSMSLLIPAFALGCAPPVLALGLPRTPNAPLPSRGVLQHAIHSVGGMLKPRYVVGARALDQ
jgi:hypothetical protein